MHVRVSTALGTPVIADQEELLVGSLSYPLIHADSGKIEGFYLQSGSWFMPDNLFVASASITAWGTAVHVRSTEYISPPEDILRIASALDDPRKFLGQRIIVQTTGRYLGRLYDIQFDTKTCMTEWLFPKRFLTLRSPIPASDILEVTPSAIIVRDPMRVAPELQSEEAQKKDLGFPEVLPITN